MELHNIDGLLREYNDTEIKHKKNIKSTYEKLPYTYDDKQRKIYQFYFQIDNSIILAKNARFDTVPIHVHNYIEINYMYSGQCQQTINDKSFHIHKGQMTFIDTKTPHSIGYTDENDIMINFMISKDYLNNSFFSKLTDHNLITTFFINAINDENVNLNYMIFNTEKNQRLQFFIHEYIWEYYNPSLNSKKILDSLFTLIILEMINTLDSSINYESFNESNSVVVSAIQYMEKNFLNCTLNSTAKYVGINPCYLTTLLKKHFHYSYKDLIIQLKMNYASKLLLNSNYSIDNIARKCGYQNLSFFYKKFKEIYKCSPKEYRYNHFHHLDL